MSTFLAEVKASQMTRIAGQTEEVALDVLSEAGKNRAYTSNLERATGMVSGAKSVGITEVALAVSGAYANRRGILVQNLGTVNIFIGQTGVTTATGIRITPNTSLWIAISEAVVLYGIAETAGQDVRVMEVA